MSKLHVNTFTLNCAYKCVKNVVFICMTEQKQAYNFIMYKFYLTHGNVLTKCLQKIFLTCQWGLFSYVK